MPETQTMALFLQRKCPIIPLQEASIAASVELRRDSISAQVRDASIDVSKRHPPTRLRQRGWNRVASNSGLPCHCRLEE
jgi:hypothetical protein